MADVAKTPVKRKSVGGKPESAKKSKGNPNKTPGKGVSPKQQNATPKLQFASPKPQNATPKQQKGGKPQKNNPKGQNGIQKSPKTEQKQKNKQQEESQKKIKPFEGTAAIESPKNKKNKPNKNKKGDEEKKPKRSLFFQYKQILISGDAAAKKQLVTTISNKIKNIEDRPDPLTKSAKRKLGVLKRIKISAEDGTPFEARDKAVAQSGKNKKAENAVANKVKAEQQKNQLQKQKQNQKVPNKKPKIEIEEEDDDSDEESDDEMADAEEVEGESEDESDEDGEEEDDDEDDDGEEDDDDEEGDSDEDESDEEETPQPKQVKTKKSEKNKPQNLKESPNPSYNPTDIEVLQKNEIVGKNQNRYILFVGNIPYDTKKDDLKEHFQKCGTIKHIRIPTEKKSLKPRGFGYIELEDAETYQKCMSMHHTFLKGRRINVLYTVGGKKNGEEKKKEMKAKNFKLHALRKQGKLAGSKKESQKRSFRRKKQKQASAEAKNESEL